MSKYDWMGPGVDELINKAVQLRVKRWTTITMFSRPDGTKMTQREQDMDQEQERRRYKYMASACIRAALWNAQKLKRIDGYPRTTVEMLNLRERLLKEISRRYEVVDRAFGAKVLRKNGTYAKLYAEKEKPVPAAPGVGTESA